MVRLILTNRSVRIENAKLATIRAIEKTTSYKVAGAHFTKAYQKKWWDGRESLLSYKRGKGYVVPPGLLWDIEQKLHMLKVKYEIVRRRKIPKNRVEYEWNPNYVLRPYQQETVDLLTKKDVYQGTGVIKLPTRSGKTVVAARIIHGLKHRAIFIVSSQELLHQAVASFKDTLGIDAGIIGDSKWTVGDVTVATVQSLSSAKSRKSDRYQDLLGRFGVLIFDEAHHLPAHKWREVVTDFNVPYRMGLSATVYMNAVKEMERGVIWLKALCGRVRIDISPSRLIEEGWLTPPTIEMHVMRNPKGFEQRRWSPLLAERLIYKNPYRNKKIVEWVEDQLKKHPNVLIITNRMVQVEEISRILESNNIPFAVIVGTMNRNERKANMDSFKDGSVRVLLGTVFGEGVDIPSTVCVVNAEGGHDKKSTMQRMRNLTPQEGKTRAVFMDFADMTNPYFAAHSKKRLEAYREEGAFDVRVIR